MNKLFLALLSAASLAGFATADSPPNILMVMVDDLGFSDLGCYGGEIDTPNLDTLAQGGLRFSQFYNTAKCHSSRVSLLTGQYCIAAGDTKLKHAVTSAEVLRDGGYFTAMSGKWHLDRQPTDFGFDRYFGHLSGACNYFLGDKTFRLNGQPWTVPNDGFYTTVADVDYGLRFLNEAQAKEQPWYLYVAFNAPHAPLQALPEDYAKYKGNYDVGWDVIHEARVTKQAELGLLPAKTTASERPDHIPAWQTLSAERRAFESKRMAALAAMIDRVDQELGRLLEHLRSTDQLDNTLIWFVSDNGACPYDRRSSPIDAEPTNGSVSWSDSTGWAWARNTPFRFYKQNQYEGGIGTPAVVHWPAGLRTKPGSICRQPAHLIDVMPTMADVAGIEIPTGQYAGRALRPVSGQSLLPIFRDGSIDRESPIHFLFASDRGLRDGDWKAVSFRGGPWKLYNVAIDRTERTDLSDREPERLEQMTETWTEMAKDVLHARGRSIAPVRESSKMIHPEWTNFELDPSSDRRGSEASNQKRSIRARKNTRLTIARNELQLTLTGDDPGLAFDKLPASLPPGPYTLSFLLHSDAVGNGEVFFTTDAKTSLPGGTRIPFDVTADSKWHQHRIALPVEASLKKLRLDVSDGRGRASIRDLELLDPQGKRLLSWP